MAKPKKWETMTESEREAWTVKNDAYKARQKAYQQSPQRKARQQSPQRKAYQKAYEQSIRAQAAADQFFILASAAEQLSAIQHQ